MKKILFIEDEGRLQEVLGLLLEQSGYEVFKALDGEIGLKMLEEKKPDLVLLDLILPKKDGFEVLAHMKSKEEIKNIPVVILTNLEEKFDIERVKSYGVQGYLIKANYNPKEIVEKVKEVLK